MSKELKFNNVTIGHFDNKYLNINNINRIVDFIYYRKYFKGDIKPFCSEWSERKSYLELEYDFRFLSKSLVQEDFKYIFDIVYNTAKYYNLDINDFFQEISNCYTSFARSLDASVYNHFIDLDNWKKEYKIRNREEIIKEIL